MTSLYSAFGHVLETTDGLLDGHCPSASDAKFGRVKIELVGKEYFQPLDLVRIESVGFDDLGFVIGRYKSIRRHGDIFELPDGVFVQVSPANGLVFVHIPSDIDPGSEGPFVLSVALLFYFKVAGFLCLHAACVSRGERTVLIIGRSGAGKSTMAAAMMLLGWDVGCEDLSVIVPSTLRVLPGYSQIKLWPTSVVALGVKDMVRSINPANPNPKFYLPIVGEPKAALIPPTDIFILEGRSPSLQSSYEVNWFDSNAECAFRIYQNILAPRSSTLLEAAADLRVCRKLAERGRGALLRMHSELTPKDAALILARLVESRFL